MAVSQQQKVDFLLKKLGFTKTKTGLAVDSTLTGTKKAGFAEAIPSPLIIANSSLWNEADSIPATPPTSDTNQVKVYLAASSGHRMTVDSTVADDRAFIAFSTYNDTSSTRLDNWIDTQFGAGYLIKVFRGDPNSGGVQLSAAGSGNADGWFFDYSAGVLNFNDTNVPSGVSGTNIYIVGYRYIGQTGAPTSGISTFSYSDLTVERNLDVGVQGGISTFRNNIDLNGNIDVSGNLDVDGTTILDHVNVSQHLRVLNGGGLQVTGITTSQAFRATGGTVSITDGGITGTVNNAALVIDEGTRIYTKEDHNGYMRNLIGKVEDVISIGSSNTGFIDEINLLPGNAGPVQLFHGTSGVTPKLFTQLGGVKVNGTTRTDNLVVLGVSTVQGNIDANSNIDLAGDLDVDGHTNLDNVSIAGVTTATGLVGFGTNITLQDNGEIRLGERVSGGNRTGDLIIRHDPSLYGNPFNVIQSNHGNIQIENRDTAGPTRFLYLKSDVVQIRSYTGNEAYLTATVNSDVKLYYNNSEKLATTNTGITVTGNTTSTGNVIAVDGVFSGNVSIGGTLTYEDVVNVDSVGIVTARAGIFLPDNQKLQLGNAAGSADLELYHDGNNSYITDTGAGDLRIRGTTRVDIGNADGSKLYFRGTNGGGANLYHNGSIRLGTSGNGINVYGSVVATGADINGDLDVDGHTNLDNVSIAGVSTFSNTVHVGTGVTIETNGQATFTGITTFHNGVRLPNFYPGSIVGKIQIGDINGYEIFHYNNDNYLTFTRPLLIRGDNIGRQIRIQPKIAQEGIIVKPDAAVELYHNGTKRLETSSVGVSIPQDLDVDGHTNLDNVSVAGVTTFSENVQIVKSSGFGALTIQGGEGTNAAINLKADDGDDNGDHWQIKSVASDNDFVIANDSSGALVEKLAIATDGTVSITNKLQITGNSTEINFVDSNNDPDYRIIVNGGKFRVQNTSNGNADVIEVLDTGYVNFDNGITVGLDLDVDGHTNLDNVSVAGVTTFAGIIEGVAGENKIPSLYANLGALPNPGTYHGMFAHVHSTQKGYFSHAGGWYELVNKETNGTVGTGTERYNIGPVDLTTLDASGIGTFASNIDVGESIRHLGDTDTKIAFDDNTINFHTNGNEVFRITQAGHLSLLIDGKNLYLPNTINHSGDGDTYFGFTGNDQFKIFTGGSARLNVQNTGVSIPQDLDVDGHTNLDNVSVTGVSTFASQVRVAGQLQLDSSLKAGGTTGGNGQYLRTTGAGVTWASFPTMRTSQTFTASAGQTTFNFTYNVGFLDVFVNGVKLSSGEFTANNGSSVVLSVGSFVGDIVELVSYFTTSYAAGDAEFTDLVQDTSPQLGGNLDLFNKFITGTGGISITGVITATSFSGTVPSSSLSGALPALDGSALTGIVASGSGVVVKNSGSTVGTAGTIDFGNNLSVSPISAGIVTITGSAGGGSGISTISGVVSIANDLDVDGHTNLDNLSVAGVSTFGSFANFGNHIKLLADNREAQFGAGNDLAIKWDGSKGGVYTNSFRVKNRLNNVNMLSITHDGAFRAYYNGLNRLDTTTAGIEVFGGAVLSGDIDVDGHTNLDNVSVAGVTTFSSAITVSDIRNNSVNLRNAAGSATYAAFSNGGAATLYFNNAPRLATSNAGITVTGSVSATAFSGDGSALTNLPGISTAHVRSETLTVSGVTTFTGDVNANKLKFPDSNGTTTNLASFGTHEDLKIYHDGSNSLLACSTGSLLIRADNLDLRPNTNSGEVYLRCTQNQGVELRYDSVKKFETTSTGAEVTGRMTATSFVGDGSGLTNVVGSGSGVIVKDDGSTVGTAGTFDFTSPINITPLSAGITTVGIDTNQFNVNNLNVSGISTFAGIISLAEKIVHTDDTNTSINFSSLDTISFVTGGGTRLQVGPVGQLGIAGATYGNPGQVLTSQGSGSIVTWADPPNNVGITTNISGSFTATAGSPTEIHSFVYGTNDRVVEYTILIEQGSNFQTLKVLASRQGTTINSTQFAVFYSSSLLAQFDVIISSSNIRLRAIPETGVTGTLAYRVKREVM